MEKPSNINCNGKAFKKNPRWKSLSILTAVESLLIKPEMEKPSNINCIGKVFK